MHPPEGGHHWLGPHQHWHWLGPHQHWHWHWHRHWWLLASLLPS
jgi:hypothetical protein